MVAGNKANKNPNAKERALVFKASRCNSLIKKIETSNTGAPSKPGKLVRLLQLTRLRKAAMGINIL